MIRTTAGLAIAALILLGLAVAAQDSYTVHGRVNATDQEAQEGYFAVDQQTMIVVRPGSALHGYLRSRVGQRVRVVIGPDGESE